MTSRQLAEELSRECFDGQVIEELVPTFEKFLKKAKEMLSE